MADNRKYYYLKLKLVNAGIAFDAYYADAEE